MKKIITISLLIGYLISKLTYFSYTMRVIDDKEIKILRDIDNFLNKYIYLNEWKSFQILNLDNVYFINHIFNFTITYFLFSFFLILFFRYIIFFKRNNFFKLISKRFIIIDNKYIKLEEYGIFVSVKNVIDFKNFNKKISFGPFKGTKWYDLEEDYIIWLYNNSFNKYRPEIEKCLFNFIFKLNKF